MKNVQASEGRNSLIGAATALVAMVIALVLAFSFAPSPASAETPAERCQRETSAYNAAWAAIGKKPPVPYKCGGSNEPPPALSPATPEEEPDETVEPTTDAPEAGSQDDGPSMTAPTERRELEHPNSGQKPIGGDQSTSATPSRTRASEATRSTSIPSSAEADRPQRHPSSTSANRPVGDNATEPFKKNVSDEGNNDTSDSACVRIWGTETRLGSNCHHYREEVRKVSTRDYTDFNDIAGICTYDENSQPCGLAHTTTRGVTVGYTGGINAKVVKSELSLSLEESVSVQFTCGAPLHPETSKGTIAFITYYEPTYTIDKYYVSGGGLAERSDEQQGKQGKGVYCRTIPRTAS